VHGGVTGDGHSVTAQLIHHLLAERGQARWCNQNIRLHHVTEHGAGHVHAHLCAVLADKVALNAHRNRHLQLIQRVAGGHPVKGAGLEIGMGQSSAVNGGTDFNG